MRSKVPVLFLAVLLSGLAIAHAADHTIGRSLTLAECIDIAVKNQPSLQVAENTAKTASEQYRESKSTYYPKVTADASYTRSEVNSQTFTPGETDNYSAFLRAEQKIYDFGRTSGTSDAAKYRAEARKDDVLKVRHEIAYNVKEAYFNVLKAMGIMKVQEASLVQAETHLRQAKGFYEVGVKAKFDVTTAEVEVNNAKLNLLKAKNTLNTSIALLKNRMGISYNAPLEIEDAQIAISPPLPLEEGIAKAYDQRPEMKGIENSMRESDASVRSAKGGYYPYITASGAYGYSNQVPAGESDNLFQDDNKRWNVGVTLTVPIFEGYLTSSKVAGASSGLDGVKAQMENTRNNIALEVTQAYLELDNAIARIEVAESSLKKARENLEIANGRYDAGVGTLIEVTDAQTASLTAETELVNARFDAAIARAKYEKAQGVS